MRVLVRSLFRTLRNSSTISGESKHKTGWFHARRLAVVDFLFRWFSPYLADWVRSRRVAGSVVLSRLPPEAGLVGILPSDAMEGLMRLRLLLFFATILAGVFGTSAGAFAFSAHTTTNLNVRSGPGTGFHRVATLPTGTRVDVRSCQGSWCDIRTSNVRGWASANHLSRSQVVVPPPVVVRPPHWHHRPPHWQHRPPHHRPPHWRPPHHRPPHHRPPHKPRPPGNCKIAPGFKCR